MDSIDDKIDEWHNSDSELPLHEYLGWSEEQYHKWVMAPDMSSYVSQNVFDGKRTLTAEEAERHRERLKRALANRKG